MRFAASLVSTVSLLTSLLVTTAIPLEAHNVTQSDGGLSKRTIYDGKFTYFYEGGYGACGGQNTDSQFVVALNAGQYNNANHCWDQISISYNGKSTTAAIVDECPGCPTYGLDLTTSLFEYLAGSLAPGVIYGTWHYL